MLGPLLPPSTVVGVIQKSSKWHLNTGIKKFTDMRKKKNFVPSKCSINERHDGADLHQKFRSAPGQLEIITFRVQRHELHYL